MWLSKMAIRVKKPGEELQQELFRFLDLPLEIRRQVYAHLVAPDPDQKRCATGTDQICRRKHGMSTSFLRVNAQINKEAIAVLKEQNLFVELTSDDPNLGDCLHQLECVCLAMRQHDDPNMVHFKHVVLRVAVDVEGVWAADNAQFLHYAREQPVTKAGERTATSYLFQHQDLSRVLLGMQLLYCVARYRGPKPAITVKVFPIGFAVYDKDTSDHFAEIILRPFLKERMGWGNFAIEGLQGSQVLDRVSAYVKEDPHAHPKDLLKVLSDRKLDADRLGQAGYDRDALALYRFVLECLKGWRLHATYPHLVSKEGMGFVVQLADLYYCTKLNTVAEETKMLESMIQTRNRFYEEWLTRSIPMRIFAATRTTETFNISYVPSKAQQAELSYLAARYNDLLSGQHELDMAWKYIKVAKRLAPDDQRIAILHKKIESKVQTAGADGTLGMTLAS